MMEKRHAWPDGHWSWPIDVTHKHGVRCGEMIWVGGQVDLTPEGVVCNPGDLAAQTRSAIVHFARVLDELDCDLEDLVTLLCFYVNDGGVDEAEFLATVGECLPPGARPAVTAVPVPYLAYEGLQVEIEGYAMRRESGERTPRMCAGARSSAAAAASTIRTPRTGTGASIASPLPAPFCQGVRSGRMIFVSAQSPIDATGEVLHPGDIVAQTRQVMGQVGEVLAELGADYDNVVKLNRWYAGDVGIASFEPAALACAAHFREPGPAATGIPLPRHADDEVKIKIAVVAMLGEDGRRLPRRHVWPESLWDWHVHLPYKHGLQCEEMIFLGGQVSLDKRGQAVHPHDLSAQTRQAMVHIGAILRELGADYEDVCKLITIYAGGCGAEALHANLPIRSSYFAEPGPATTGVPLPVLAYDAMMVEIDAFAMKRRSKP